MCKISPDQCCNFHCKLWHSSTGRRGETGLQYRFTSGLPIHGLPDISECFKVLQSKGSFVFADWFQSCIGRSERNPFEQ
ncbi:hypothetical protein Mapa_001575 [Marchantia paleacea]|nr:hypothetical protein Mapa_001575 [Marchantia paleacea]